MIQFPPLKVKVLKERTYVKRVQNAVYNKHRAEWSDGDMLVHVNFAESYRNDQQSKAPTLEIKAFYIVFLF